jgi:hypothetical protein
MAFQFAYTTNGQSVGVVNDFPLDTLENYQNGTGTNGVKKGDLVVLNNGLVRRADASATSALGVVEGTEFTGLVAQGQPYAATNSSFTAEVLDTDKNPNGVVKVRVNADAVYRVPVKSGQTATNANIGGEYGIATDASGDQTVDLTSTTNTVVKVIDISKDGKFVFVTLKMS